MTDLKINPMGAPKAEIDESMHRETTASLHEASLHEASLHEASLHEASLVHEASRTMLLLTPLNACEFLKRTLQKSGFVPLSPARTSAHLATLEHDSREWLCVSVVRDPVERAFAGYVEFFLSAASTSPAQELCRLIASINGQSVKSFNPSNAGRCELSFRQFCRALISLRDEQLPRVFRSQIAWLPQTNQSLWHVDYCEIPQMLMAVEQRINVRVSPKKTRNSFRRRAVSSAESLINRSSDRLRQLDGIPRLEDFLAENLADALRQRFRADWELSKRAAMNPARDAAVQHVFSSARQISSKTSFDRYPEIFQFAARQLKPGHDRLNILSLGCSTGEECHSLRKYFPAANICGVDLRAQTLKKARVANADPGIKFHQSTPQFWQNCGSFDAIFAMTVFCRWPDTMYAEDCSAFYRFDQFQSDLQQLDTHLHTGSLLVIYNANFRFDATDVSRNYESLIVPLQPESGFVTKFSSQNIRLEDQTMQQCVFRKIS
jgi:hypothetical protein